MTQENNYLEEYRSELVSARYVAQNQYDKTVIVLSGGALGLSLTFIDKFLNNAEIHCLTLLGSAWGFWTSSLIISLIGFYLSPLSYDYVIKKINRKEELGENPGGLFTIVINIINFTSGTMFIIGVIAMTYFMTMNIGD